MNCLRAVSVCLLAVAILVAWPQAVMAQHQHTPGMDMSGSQPAADATGEAKPAHEMGYQMPRMIGGVPLSIVVGIIPLLILVVLWAIAYTRHWHKPSPGVLGGLALLLAAYLITAFLVHKYRRPGQATVVEATVMDMSAMKPPEGAMPVDLAQVECADFTATVSYTGTVVALNDQDIYPRVTGRVISMPAYPGDEIRPGQLIVRLDDIELGAREREAAAATRTAAANARAAREQVAAAEAMRRQRQAGQEAATVMITEASRMAQAARAKRTEAEKALNKAREEVRVAQSEQTMATAGLRRAEAMSESARAAITNAEGELDAATADVTYWQAELQRMKTLRENGAVSIDEYQVAETSQKAAAADVKRAKAMIEEKRSDLKAALAMVREAQADTDRAQSMIAAAQAEVDQMAAGVEMATAEAQAADTRIDAARAEARAASAEVAGQAAQVRASAAQERASAAGTQQASAALAVARTVRGYTEIRAVGSARVIQRVVSPSTLVNPGTLLLRLAQVDRVRLQANVSQADVAHIKVGARVTAHRVDQADRPVIATVTSVFPAADPAARTSIVEAIVDNAQRRFLPGQAIAMAIETASLDLALTVPSSAIITKPVTVGGQVKHAVWTVALKESTTGTIYSCVMDPEIQQKEPGTCPKCRMDLTPTQASGAQRIAHLSNVTIGPSGQGRTVILSGVAAGQEIVTRGQQNLREGQAVHKVDWGPGGPVGMPPGPSAPAEQPAATGHEGHGM